MKRIICAIVITTITLTANAQRQLSLAECRDMAIENNRQIKAALFNRQKAAATITQYRGNYLPTIDASGTGLLSSTNGGFDIPELQLPVFLGKGATSPSGFAYLPASAIDYNVHSLWHAGVSLSQPLYMSGRISSGLRMARLGAEMAEWNWRKTTDDVLIQADEAYMMLVKASQLRSVSNAYSGLIDNVLKNVESAHRAGIATRNDVTRAQVAQGESQLLSAQADNACRLASMNLCHIVGLPMITEIEAADTAAPEVTLTMLDLQGAVSDRPDYNMLQLKTGMAEQQISLARADYLPQVGVQLNYGLLHGGHLGAGDLLDRAIFDKRTSFSAIISVKVPIYDFGKTSGKYRAAKAEYEAAKYDQDDLVEQMQLEAMQCHNRLAEAMLEVNISERNRQLADENLRVSNSGYKAGTTTLSDLLEANLLWLQANQRLVEARYQAYIAYLRYAKSIGHPIQSL